MVSLFFICGDFMNKDLDYIAGLEKAVEEKYGKNAIINPKSLWSEAKEEEYKKQLRERSIKERKNNEKYQTVDKDGFLIKKKLVNMSADRTCPVKECGKFSFNTKDDVYMNKFGCCYECYIKYVEGREQEWDTKRKELTDVG